MVTLHFKTLPEEGKIEVWFSNESEEIQFCRFKVDYLEFSDVETLFAFFHIIVEKLSELGLIKFEPEEGE